VIWKSWAFVLRFLLLLLSPDQQMTVYEAKTASVHILSKIVFTNYIITAFNAT